MVALESIGGPDDLRRLSPPELDDLAAADPRVPRGARSPAPAATSAPTSASSSSPSRCTGCSTPRATGRLCDTGHQAYVHKLLTGRHDDFARLSRPAGSPATRAGPSPSTTSSRTRHASTALSWADGIAKGFAAARRARPARRRRHRRRRADRRHGLGGAQQHRRRRTGPSSSSSTTTSGPTRRRSAASPTTSPRCARPGLRALPRVGAGGPAAARRWSACPSTRRCTG